MNTVTSTPEVDQELVRFFDFLSSNTPFILKQPIRHTIRGMFVSEQAIDILVSHFQPWLQKESASATTLPEERCRRRLFGTETPELYYLLEGKNCLAGFITPPVGNLNRWQRYNGAPIEGRTFLHPRDPKLAQLSGFTMRSTPHGKEFEFTNGPCALRMSEDLTTRFLELIPHSLRLRRIKDQFSGPLRQSLQHLPDLLRRGRRLPAHKLRLLPSRARRDTNLEALLLGDIAILMDTKGSMLTCFGLKGRNLFKFVQQELQDLKRSVRSGKVGVMDLRSRDPRVVGSVRNRTDRFDVDIQALLEFIQQHHAPSSKGNKAATVFDFVGIMASEIAHSSWILERDVPPRARGKQGEYRSFLASDNWIFRLPKREVIKSCQRKGRPRIAASRPKP